MRLGENALNVAGVQALATLPSLDDLRGKLVGLIQAPATKIAGALAAPAGQLARVFGAYGPRKTARRRRKARSYRHHVSEVRDTRR